MGTKIYKMPLTWQHPVDESGEYIQISTMRYDQALEEYTADPEEYDGVKPLPEEYFPEIKEGQPFGFMFCSSVSDLPRSDEIFTDRRKMLLWWIYTGRALEAKSHNWSAIYRTERLSDEINFWFDREGVPPADMTPIKADEVALCLVLDGQQRRVYAKARQAYKDGQGVSSDALDAMFEMFDAWLK